MKVGDVWECECGLNKLINRLIIPTDPFYPFIHSPIHHFHTNLSIGNKQIQVSILQVKPLAEVKMGQGLP